MVRTLLLAGLVLALAAPARAQTVDWRGAGGDLFGAPAPEPHRTETAENPDPVRVAPPAQPWREAVEAAARDYGLDPKLLHALIVTESAYRPDVCSPAGACGLAQLMPATALDLGVKNRLDPVENLRGGADYLARQMVRFGDVRLALAAYNAGPARVARVGRVPDIAETRQYVATVIECYLALSAGRTIASARQCGRGEERP
ncbi:lytic transglycosylase domain-containing protein [Brevundimonas goettingensis]|uniref:Lytic transglycosylase domain-containing protein n=1 Tax=Brevundimonas goettingensis TaxID=2774190 RepID=A0A975C6B8_9CAUL|nr:lytic transglycosylase domain-containing protein [Brevundimonas goettingensis]QTC92790.1 lytic transglycosylase domain-containing protein [Brevundimonas goettingensis]